MKNFTPCLYQALDKGYSIDEASFSIQKGGTPITNFIPEVTTVECLHNGDVESMLYGICFHFTNQKEVSVKASSNTLEKQSFYPDCAVFKGAKKVVTDFIRRQILLMDTDHFYQFSNGWNQLDSQNFYMLGTYRCGQSSYRLSTCDTPISISNDTPYQNACYLWEFTNLCPNVAPILLLGTVVGLLSSPFKDAGASPLILYLYGESSTFKTSLAALLTAVHGYEANLITLSSSWSSIRDYLISNKDIPVVIDDMNKSDRKTIMHRNEEIISNYCKTVVDSGKLILHHGKDTCEVVFHNSSVITAEYILNNLSTRNRTIELPMESISTDCLTHCQQLQNTNYVMETFAFHFTSFVSENWESICERIKADLQQSQYDLRDSKSKSAYRINANLRQLFAAAHIMTLYLQDCAKLPADYVRNWCNKFYKSIRTVCADQLHSIADKESGFSDASYLIPFYKTISQIHGPMENWPVGEDAYKETRRRVRNGKMDFYGGMPVGFIDEKNEDYICIKGETLLKLLREDNPDATQKAFSKQLSIYNLVKKDSNGKCSIRINSHKSRYYHINIVDLKRIIDEINTKR